MRDRWVRQPGRVTAMCLCAAGWLACSDFASEYDRLTVFDCAGSAAAGVRVELDTPAVPFAIIDGLPITNQRTTTSYATVGFFNVGPGVSVVSGYRADTGDIVGRDAIPVRAGWDTLVTMMPEQGLEP